MNIKNKFSLFAILIAACLLLAALRYYPRYSTPKTEAAISWDVAGYYTYLPAIFIYNDILKCEFRDSIWAKYSPSPHWDLAWRDSVSGNFIMKHSLGQALSMSPAFAAAHIYTRSTNVYPADGYSFPYQLAIALWGVFISCVGLLFLRAALLRYYSDGTVASVILLLVLTTNYWIYAGMSAGMTHTYVFTMYATLLYATIRFYERPSYAWAALIGAMVGWAALTRPTEIISCIIPLLWGVQMPLVSAIQTRIGFIRQHLPKFLLAMVVCLSFGSLQLMYWKYASNHWIVYSYKGETFSWLSPHIWKGLTSSRNGWLMYTPMMSLALGGFILLYKRLTTSFIALLVMAVVAIYVTFAWDCWWYGGSVGARAMVQHYAVLCFPLAASLEWLWRAAWRRIFIVSFSAICLYYNVWLIHQAHYGGLYRSEYMTSAYWRRVVGRWSVPPEIDKYLDNPDNYAGEPSQSTILFETNFETDTTRLRSDANPIEGQFSAYLDDRAYSITPFDVPLPPQSARWLRFSAMVWADGKEWDNWQMAQMYICYKQGRNVIKKSVIRLDRFFPCAVPMRMHVDSRIPQDKFDKIEIGMERGSSKRWVMSDTWGVEAFE